MDVLLGFFATLSAALLVGTMFGIALSFNPAGLEPLAYTLQQQHGIRTLNTALPALGAVTLLLTVTHAVVTRGSPVSACLLFGAAACLLAAGLITRFGNQPINIEVLQWSASAPPADWTRLRDAWWYWHVARTVIGILGLALMIAALLKRS